MVDTELHCENQIGRISSSLSEACSGDTVRIAYDSTGQILSLDDTLIFFIYTDLTAPLASLFSYLSDTTLGITNDKGIYTAGKMYYIGANLGPSNHLGEIDYSQSCIRESYGHPFIFNEKPKIDLVNDTLVCGSLEVMLEAKAEKEYKFVEYTWDQISGPIEDFIFNKFSSKTQISGFKYGERTFKVTIKNEGCISYDTINIDFHEAPKITDINNLCIYENNKQFTVTAKINNGEKPYELITPYGKLVGNNLDNFLSDTINNLENLYIQVKDAKHCLSNLILDTYNCDCGIFVKPRNEFYTCTDSLFVETIAIDNFPIRWRQLNGPQGMIIHIKDLKKSLMQFKQHGNYTIEYSIHGTCNYFDTMYIHFVEPPKANINGMQYLSYPKDTIELSAVGSKSGSGSTLLYHWKGPLKFITDTSELRSSKIHVSGPGKFILNVVDSLSNCSDDAAKFVYFKIQAEKKKPSSTDSLDDIIKKEIENLVLTNEDIVNCNLNSSKLYIIQFYDAMGRALTDSFPELAASFKNKNIISSIVYYRITYYNEDHQWISCSGRLNLNNQ